VLDTLPERAALAKSSSISHLDFLAMVLSDEVTRRDRTSASVRARAAHLDPKMTLERWDASAAVSYDKAVLDELVSLRFVEDAYNALVLGPVGVGKTFIATALGHIACRRRVRAHFERADRLFKRLKACRLDGTYDAEVRKLVATELVIIDDFALQGLDQTETADFYALVVERHRRASTVVTSNRCLPSRRSTACKAPRSSSSSRESPTGARRSRPLARTRAMGHGHERSRYPSTREPARTAGGFVTLRNTGRADL
jgi:DNA replication protein DnaC